MFRKLGNTIGAVVVATGLMFGGLQSAQAVVVPADIAWVVDYSGSMGPDINEVINNIGAFQTAIDLAGIDARYGAVQFGQSANGGDAILLTDLTDAAGLSAALTGALPVGGGTEPGSRATTFTLNNISWRPGARKNIILITDEDDDSSVADNAVADALLTQNQALFNAIIDPVADVNSFNCPSCYTDLANNHGGTVFNILDFRNDPQTFLDNFNRTKIQEILQPVPEPSILALLGLGLAGLGVFRRRTCRV